MIFKKFRIGGKIVAAGRAYIIAEAGVNHNGDPALAAKMVDMAAAAGADAVKFQMFNADDIVTRSAAQARYQKNKSPAKTQYDMLKKLQLSAGDFKKLAKRARQRNIHFLATPFDDASADLLDKLKVPAFKIASPEITNHGLLAHVARKKKPVILSTGMSDIAEIRNALSVLKKNGAKDIALMQCTSAYPCSPENANLAAIAALRAEFGLPTGFSDHTAGWLADAAAAALGAALIEKHFTPDRKMRGPDHAASLEPGELKEMVAAVRLVEKMLGNGLKRSLPCELDALKAARKSIVAGSDIASGATIKRSDICFKRPGTGLPPYKIRFVVGATARRQIKKDTLVTPSALRYAR